MKKKVFGLRWWIIGVAASFLGWLLVYHDLTGIVVGIAAGSIANFLSED